MPNDYSLKLRNQVVEIKQLGEKLDAFGKQHGLSKSLDLRSKPRS